MSYDRIVLLSNRSLLASGVQRLLQGMDGLKLSTVDMDGTDVAVKIRQLAPQVIILDSGDYSLDAGFIMRVLEVHPEARIIALNLNRKGIEVYRMKRVLQADLNGLLEAIRGKSASKHQERGQRHRAGDGTEVER